MQGLNDIKIKELLTKYIHPQQTTTLSGSRSNFNSLDKTHQVTYVSSTTDISLQNLMKFKHYFNPIQLSQTHRSYKPKPPIYNKISIFKASQLKSKPKPNLKKAPSIYYLTKGLKTHARQQTNNVMNIVNNINENNPLLTSRSNKNVEINFNKYEIKILSNKRNNHHENDRKKIRIITPIKKEMNLNKKRSLTNDENIIMFNLQKDLKAENKCFTSRSGIESARQIIKKKTKLEKNSLTENDDSDTLSNIICLKQPVQDIQMVHLVNRKNSKIHNTQLIFRRSIDKVNTISIIHDDKKRKSEINDKKIENHIVNNDENKAIDIDKPIINDKENRNEPILRPSLTIISAPDQIQDPETIDINNPINSQPQFKCFMMITTQSCFSFEGNQIKSEAKLDSILTQEKIDVKPDEKNLEQSQPSIKTFAPILLNSNKKSINPCKYSLISSRKSPCKPSNICEDGLILKLNSDYNTDIIKRNSSNSKNHSRSIEIDKSLEKEISLNSQLSKFGKSKQCSKINIFESKIEPLLLNNNVDSSDLSVDDCILTKQTNSQLEEPKFNSNMQIKRISITETSQNNENYYTDIGHSSRNCSNIPLVKDTSAFGFLLKRAASTLLKKKQKKEITFQIKNNKKMLSPRKINKRFMKQLSNIAEISHINNRFLPNRKVSKLNKATSLPLFSIEKLSNYQFFQNPSRQLTHVALPTLQLLNISYEEESPVGKKKKKKNTIIPEEEQISLTLHSKSSSEDDRKSKKRPSLLSNNSINFCDLRANSIQISTNLSKCLLPINREQCQAFITKYVQEITNQSDGIDSKSIQSKDSLINKSTKSIKLYLDRLDQKRMQTISQCASNTLHDIASHHQLDKNAFILNKEENILFKQLDIINECSYYEFFFDNIYYTFAHDTIKFLSFRRCFEVDIMYHLDKEKYLDSDFIELSPSLINNFQKKTFNYKRIKSSVSIKHQKLFQHMTTLPKQISKKEKKKAEVPVVINVVYCFRFIKLDDNLFYEKQAPHMDMCVCPIKKRKVQSNRKSIQFSELSFGKKRINLAMPKPNSRKGSLSVKRSSDIDLSPMNYKKDTLLDKPLYFRRRRIYMTSK